MNSVNRIFLRRSGILNALTKAFSTAVLRAFYRPPGPPSSAEYLGLAPGLLDLGSRRGRERVRPDRDGPAQVTSGQNLDRKPGAHQTTVAHGLGIDLLGPLE